MVAMKNKDSTLNFNSEWFPKLDPGAIGERLAFLRLSSKDIEQLKSSHELFSDLTETIIDEFYTHLLSYEDTARFIDNEEVLLHLKEVQTRYFQGLTAGNYDDAYVQERLNIGHVHQKIGLDPYLYLNSYNIYVQLLIKEISALSKDNSHIDALELLKPLFKVISFDMGLAIEAYMQSDQWHIHHRIDQLYTINQAALALNAPTSLDSKLEMIMRNGIHLAGGDASCIAFYDPEQQRLINWTTEGLSNDFIRNMSFRPGGLADRVIQRNNYVLSNDNPDSEHKLSRLVRREGIKSFVCMPLIFQGSPLGVIYVYNKSHDSFSSDQVTLLTTLSNLAAGAIATTQLLETTERMATVDALTGLINRRRFDELFDIELKRAFRYQHGLSLLMFDIDHFKSINDTHGHPVGDLALQHIAQIIGKVLRDIDTPARYGGEEFVAILPETGIEGARLVAERLRSEIESTPLPMDETEDIAMTMSIGIANFPDCADTIEQLTQFADQALYKSKEQGRNRVTAYQDISA